jgi:tetratricopeptide (TPR) repeat protein
LQDLPAFEAALERALVLDPNCAEALRLLANTSLQCGNAAQAAQLYQRLIALKPDDTSVLLPLAKCLFVLGDKAGARSAFKRVLGIDPANPVARENLAILEAPAAGPAFVPAPDSAAGASQPGPLPADVANWVAQADAAYARGELLVALAALQQAARHAPLCATLWVALANIQTQLRLYPDALESCLAAEAMQPKVVDILVRLAAAALRCDDIPRFESALGRALGLEPGNIGALRLLADLNLQQKRYQDAARQYRQILQQTSQDSEVALCLGRCELEAGHLEAARRAFEQVLELEPGLEPAQQALKKLEEKIARQTANQRRDRVKVNWIEVTSKLAQLNQPAASAP